MCVYQIRKLCEFRTKSFVLIKYVRNVFIRCNYELKNLIYESLKIKIKKQKKNAYCVNLTKSKTKSIAAIFIHKIGRNRLYLPTDAARRVPPFDDNSS